MNKNSNKKICLFLNNLSYGGAEKVVITLANYLDLNDFDVTILTLKHKNDYKSLINSSVKHISLDINRIRSSIMPLFSFLRAKYRA